MNEELKKLIDKLIVVDNEMRHEFVIVRGYREEEVEDMITTFWSNARMSTE